MKLTIAAILLLLSQSSNGNWINEKCNNRNFIANLVNDAALAPADLAAAAMCSGSLISLNFLVTTASCAYKFLRKHGALRSLPNVTVRAGFDPESNTFQERTMARFVSFAAAPPYIKNKNWSKKKVQSARSSQQDDLVLVELNEPFRPSPNLQVIKLAKKGQADQCKQAETVTAIPDVEKQGGARGLIFNVVKGRLKAIPLKIVCKGVSLVKKALCFRFWAWLTSRFILCGQAQATKPWFKRLFKREAEESGCEGAEGSPLVCDGALIGLQSQCKRGGARSDQVQTSFLNIDPYLDFLATNVKGLGQEVQNVRHRKRHKTTDKTTTEKPASSGAAAYWEMAAGLCFVCLFLIGFT